MVSSKATPLGAMLIGDWVEVVGLSGDSDARWRLMDLGLVAGTKVEVVRASPLGDPILYRFRGITMAIRKPDADVVLVRRLAAHPQG